MLLFARRCFISTKRMAQINTDKGVTQAISATTDMESLLQEINTRKDEYNPTHLSTAMFRLGKLTSKDSKSTGKPKSELAADKKVQDAVDLLFTRLKEVKRLTPRNIGNVCDGVHRGKLVQKLPEFFVKQVDTCEFSFSSYFDKVTPLANAFVCTAELGHIDLASKLAKEITTKHGVINEKTSVQTVQKILTGLSLIKPTNSPPPSKEFFQQVNTQLQAKVGDLFANDAVAMLHTLHEFGALEANLVQACIQQKEINKYYTEEVVAKIQTLAPA